MVDLDKIKIFYYVAKEGSIKKAAPLLGKNLSTLSKHLSDLEETLNTKLFIRKRQGLELTESGKELFYVAQSSVPNLENVCHELVKSEQKQRQLTLITTTGVTSIWATQKLTQFIKTNENINIRIITTNEDIDFKSSKADVGLLPKVYSPQGLSQQKILTFHIKLYASREYIDTYSMPKTLDDLKNHKLISFYSDFIGYYRGNVDWHMRVGKPDEPQRNNWFSVNSAICQFEAACRGLGIVSLPKEFAYIQGSNLIEILPDHQVPIDIYFVTRSTDRQSDLVKKCYAELSRSGSLSEEESTQTNNKAGVD